MPTRPINVTFVSRFTANMWNTRDRPGATEGIPGPCPPQITACAPPNENCAPLSENCAPKKATGSVPHECSSKPETPKILVIIPEIVSKNCFFAGFAIKIYFLRFHPRIVKICDKDLRFLVHTLEFQALKFLCSRKICLCPPQSRNPDA